MFTFRIGEYNLFGFGASDSPDVPPPQDLPDEVTLLNLFAGTPPCNSAHAAWEFCEGEARGLACRNRVPVWWAVAALFHHQPGYQRSAWNALPETWRIEFTERLPRCDLDTGSLLLELIWAHVALQSRRALHQSEPLRDALRTYQQDAAALLTLLPPAWFPSHAVAARRLSEAAVRARADERRRILNPRTSDGHLPHFLRGVPLAERRAHIDNVWLTPEHIRARFASRGIDHDPNARLMRQRVWELTFRPMVGTLLRHVPGGRGHRGEAKSLHFRLRKACEVAHQIAREVLGAAWPGTPEVIRHMVRDRRAQAYRPAARIRTHLHAALGLAHYLR